MRSRSYKDLIVWQKSMNLVTLVYKITMRFPPSEQFGLSSQMQRAATSIPSNIAEGSKRNTKRDFNRFIAIAHASAAELETQMEIIKRLPFGKLPDIESAESMLIEVIKMLNGLANSLST